MCSMTLMGCVLCKLFVRCYARIRNCSVLSVISYSRIVLFSSTGAVHFSLFSPFVIRCGLPMLSFMCFLWSGLIVLPLVLHMVYFSGISPYLHLMHFYRIFNLCHVSTSCYFFNRFLYISVKKISGKILSFVCISTQTS